MKDAQRLLGVVLDHRNFRVIRPLIGRKRSVHRPRGAVIEILDDRFQIDAHRQRAPETFVGENRVACVPWDVVVVERVEAPKIDEFLQLGAVALRDPRIGRDDRFVDIAALHGRPRGRVVVDDFEEHALKIRSRAPVFGPPFEQNFFARNPAHQTIRSAANGA